MKHLALLLVLLSCKRADVARPDPTPPVDAKPAPPPTPSSPLLGLHGRVVDVVKGEVTQELRNTLPWDEVNDGRAVYVLDKDAMLRAWEPQTGKPLWSLATSARTLESDTSFLYLVQGTDVAVVNKASGVPRMLSTSAPIEELRPFAGHFAVRHGSTIDIYDAKLHVKGTFASPTSLDRFIDDYRIALVATPNSVCFVSFVPPDFEVRCLDENAKETVHAVVALAGGGTHVGGITYSRHHLVIGTHSFIPSSPRAAVVVRLSDGKLVARVPDEVVALVESDTGALEGTIAVGAEVRFYDAAGARRWTYKPKWAESFAKVLVQGNTLVFAMHNIIATGVQVFALRKSDGVELWLGDTKLPPIGHSKYHNHVTLEALADAVILRGHESSVEHVHVYDVTTGKLRYHDP